eukprot:CAMPEP_0201877044 /NCGR_PEP_ID=MMETSP0902-20130614/8557_1 /ASSEMBLY_ACC=CAM_ASM_000551 /TAXON_ID=420261 /ORGANISM="Thalassiosira antarctica, Strain CCMP982" /LENGTH=281 /DNA_ID=CAMNT_0048404411 /DNA_START=106 /DNA_END=951 /DNA_ORIENTATION=-
MALLKMTLTMLTVVALNLFAWFEPLYAFSSNTAPAGIRIRKLEADTNFLFPTNAKRLTEFLMDATYGECRPFSAAWAQRAVIDAAARSDLFSRLAYYQKRLDENDDAGGGVSSGAIFIAEKEENNCELVGFVDVGASLWVPEEGTFQLPMNDDLKKRAAAIAAGNSSPQMMIRPYVSNLVVDNRMRRRGVGKSLMAACEAEVAGWISDDQNNNKACATNICLEVTSTNREALGFYRAAGYVIAEGGGSTPGTELKREGDGFRMIDVQRCLMQKDLMQISPL